MSRLLLLCILLIGCRPKNKLSSEGLKVGEWKEQVNDSLTEIGEYKIISIANYDTIRHLGESWIEVRYRKSTPLLFYNSRSSNNISVRHGLWQLINSNGKVYEEKFWNLGLSDSSKYYNEDGSINFFEYDDYETDTSFYLTYKDNRLFKKAFYPPEDKNNQTEIYYPNNNLYISNCEVYFSGIYHSPKKSSNTINISSKTPLEINSISSSSNTLETNFTKNNLPYSLNKNDTLRLSLLYTPDPTSLILYDTITIQTSEKHVPPYKIYCSLHFAHLDYTNIEETHTLSLSKSKDKYLYISRLGSQTDAYLVNKNGFKKHYETNKEINKIDLSQLEIGNYNLTIISCNTGGGIILNITK